MDSLTSSSPAPHLLTYLLTQGGLLNVLLSGPDVRTASPAVLSAWQMGATALFACPSLITEAGYATRSGASIRAIVLGGEAVCSTWLLAALGLVGLLMVVSK